MRRIFIRLDDACPKYDKHKWERMEQLLDKYKIRPLVGVIPDCKDPDMEKYPYDDLFWSETIERWKKKRWTLALHGYEHVFNTHDAGINPVNQRSEFAGLSLEKQRQMIKNGVGILNSYSIHPKVFFAPAHTYDNNTLKALMMESEIRVISDTPANDVYHRDGFIFIPQQSGRVRKLPFKTITFCYHPNIMKNSDFIQLEEYMKAHKISSFELINTKRHLSLYDRLLMSVYYWRHR